jgi:hypothetical protein
MEKLLTAVWFKKIGFPSKMDGMSFIKSQKKLVKFMDEKTDEVEEFKYQKVAEFEEYFEKFEKEKSVFLVGVKEKQKERIQQKKDIQKQSLKEEMRAEILKEITEEENQKNYPKVFPIYDKEEVSLYVTLDEMFSSAIKKMKRGELNKAEIKQLEKLKEQAEGAFATLSNVCKTLKEYE